MQCNAGTVIDVGQRSEPSIGGTPTAQPVATWTDAQRGGDPTSAASTTPKEPGEGMARRARSCARPG